jgi:hypothetical protein
VAGSHGGFHGYAHGSGLGAGGAARAHFARAEMSHGFGQNNPGVHGHFRFNDWLEANQFFNCYPPEKRQIGQNFNCVHATKKRLPPD